MTLPPAPDPARTSPRVVTSAPAVIPLGGARPGGPGWIRTIVGNAGRFTVCSLWPLGHRPRTGDASGAPLAGAPDLPRSAVDALANGPGATAPLPSTTMPSFDVVSEVDRQEVRNAVDQAQRELATRFDFKNTSSS